MPASTICPDCAAVYDHGAFAGMCPHCMMQGAATLPIAGQERGAGRQTGPMPGYTMKSLLGSGGMGMVYRMQQQELDRDVAVKVISDGGVDPEFADRFIREAKVLARLEHPNIVPIHELGQDDEGQVFYTMKLVNGRTLQAVIDDLSGGNVETLRIFTLPRLLAVLRKVCDAVAFAHAHGILHRDLKPENIMVGEFGEVLVMDWGLAKQIQGKEGMIDGPKANAPGRSTIHSQLSATQAGSVMGTPQYMSPEQAAGLVHELDERSDVYSLGGILYGILTLRPPVEGATLEEVLLKVRTGEVRPPSSFDPGTSTRTPTSAKGAVLEPRRIEPLPHCAGGRVPPALSAVAMKALARLKEKRYATADALAADIDAYQNGFATIAEKAGVMKQITLLVRRHKAIFGMAFGAWLVITALAVWFVLSVQASERRAVANEQIAVREKELTRRSLAKAQIDVAESAAHEQDGMAMKAALGSVPKDLRESNWFYLQKKSDTSLAVLRPHFTGEITCAVPHPTRPGVFAISGMDCWIALVEAQTGKKLLEFQAGFAEKNMVNFRLTFSPDGERLAIGRAVDGGVVIHDTHDGRMLAHWETGSMDTLEFSPGGKHLLETILYKQINLCDAATGRQIWSVAGAFPRASFTSDGKAILAAFNLRVKLLDASNGALLRDLPEARDRINALAIRPDGRRALIGEENGFVRCIDLQTGHVLYEMRANDRSIAALAYLPEGDQFVSLSVLSGERQSLQVWDAETGMLTKALLGGTGEHFRVNTVGLRVHPLSGEIVAVGRTAKSWSIPGQRESRRFDVRANSNNIAFWKTDDWLFAPGSAADVELLDLRTASPMTQPLWKPEALPYRAVSVSADGRFAAVAETGTNQHIHVLSEHDGRIEEIRLLQLTSLIGQMELNASGSRLWNGHSVVDPATGAEMMRMERTNMFSRFLASRWVSATQVIEAVTLKARRGQVEAEEQIVLWDTDTGRAARMIPSPSVIFALAVAPDGRTFAEAGADKMVRLRDARTLEVKQEFRAHDGPIMALAYHPTQPILATASEDLTIKLWNLVTGEIVDELRGPLAAPMHLAFSPTGKRIACLARDRTVRLWEPKSLNP